MANAPVQQQDRVMALLAREFFVRNDEYAVEWAIDGIKRGLGFEGTLDAVAQAIANARRDGYRAGLSAGGTKLSPEDVLPDPKLPAKVDGLPAFWDQRRLDEGKPDRSRCAEELRVVLGRLKVKNR